MYISNIKKILEEVNDEDFITINIPLFIRLLEYSREDSKNDVDLHNIVEKAIKLNKKLSMDDYNNLINNKNINEATEEKALATAEKMSKNSKIPYVVTKDSKGEFWTLTKKLWDSYGEKFQSKYELIKTIGE